MGGSAAMLITGNFIDLTESWMTLFENVLLYSIIFNLFIMVMELTITHPTDDAHRAVKMITKGRYSKLFWIGVVLVSNIIPLCLLMLGSGSLGILTALLVIIGIYFTEKIWIEAPQRIPLT